VSIIAIAEEVFFLGFRFSAYSPAVQHLFHRFAVPLLLRRRYVLIHFTVSGKILAFTSASLRVSSHKKQNPHGLTTVGIRRS